MEETIAGLITAVESLKWRNKQLETVLLNFEGIYLDADGVLRFGKQVAPTPAPEPTPLPETEPEPEEGIEIG